MCVCVCVFVALGTQRERGMAILSSVAYPALVYFSTLPHKRYDLRNKVCFDFLYKFGLKYFSF
jgi:hypothetical protein